MKVGVVAAACLSALAVWVAPSAGTATKCKPGERTVRGVTLVIHCGPAQATVQVGDVRYRIFGGRCRKPPGGGLYIVEVGILTVAGSKPTARYLGLFSKRLKDGVVRGASIAVQAGRRSYSVAPNVIRISGGMKRGTFSGDALGPAGRVSGSWRC